MRILPKNEEPEEAFSRMVRENASSLRTLALRITKCEQLAQDIVQDVFLKLWEQRNQLHNIENEEAWLYRVTENKLIDHLRRTAAEKKMKDRARLRTAERHNETEQLLAARDSGKFIARAVENLPSQRKIIFRLNREQQLSHQEIAEELNISRHTVKNQLSSALQYLRACLKGIRIF